jgi:transposase
MLQKFFEAWRLACDCQITLAERRLLLRCVLLPSETVRFVSEWRQNGATSAKSQGSDQRSHRIEAHREMILSVIKAKPDMTLVQIAEMLEAETGASFAPSSVWRFLDRHAITFKKTAHAAEQDRPDVAAARGLA